MRKYGLGKIAIAIMLTIANSSFAQSSNTVDVKKGADLNFGEMARYYKEHPWPRERKMPFDEDDNEEHRTPHSAPSSQVHMYHPGALRGAMGPAYGPMLPVSAPPNDSFLSTASPGSAIPPDTHGAVDSQYCVTAINTDIHIQTRVGGDVLDFNLDAFWSSVLPAGTSCFDPRIHYDQYNKRWILVTDAVNGSGTSMTGSTVLLAVTATNDPTGVWHMYSLTVDPTNASWLDFPNLGYNNKWVVVTGNIFGGVGGCAVYIFNYANLMAGTATTATKISETSSFAICPAETLDPTEPNIFAVESWNSGSGQLRLWKISGAVGSPAISSVGYPSTSQHWHGSGSTNFATQIGTTNKVDAGDDRFTSLVFKNKKLWCTHTVFLPSPGSASRASVQWWQLDTLANPLQIGYVNDAVTPTFFDYSSIAVNDSNDALIGFGYLNSTVHPSAAYALHMHTDPIDSTRPPHIFRHGQATYYTTFGGSRNRWGDYSGTCLDPRNNMDFWTIQEASNATGTTANWECWWANVQICPKPQAPTLTYTAAPCAGDTASFIISPIAGATSYIWYTSGTGWTGSSTTTTLNATAGTGVGTIVVLAYNSCGEGESNTFTITPNTPPAAPSISVYTPPCTGTTTAVFTASGSSAYNWWVVGTGWSGTSSSSTFTTTVGTGTAFIICNSSNACGIGPNDTLTIAPGTPVATFTETTHSTVIGVNVTINFTGSAPVGSTYTWNFAGGIATPGTGSGPQSVHWTTGGTKMVTLIVDNNGCSSTFTDTVHVKDPTGINELNNPDDNISIVPNPSEGLFDIVFTSPVNKSVTVRMADMEGRIVYSNEFLSVANNKLQVRALNLPPGIYAVAIYIDGNAVTKKITINK